MSEGEINFTDQHIRLQQPYIQDIYTTFVQTTMKKREIASSISSLVTIWETSQSLVPDVVS